jgi:hypothetical protein
MGQNLMSGVIAGLIALVIYTTIAAIFNHGLAWWIVRVGLLYGVATLIVTFLISRIISVRKAKG